MIMYDIYYICNSIWLGIYRCIYDRWLDMYHNGYINIIWYRYNYNGSDVVINTMW